ncbi:MAG: hypothetical protein FWC24_04150, partial [Treponema sp.]|nr:hypothetical protein [Treponema sp.]
MISYIGLSLLSIEPGTVPRNRREGTGRALLSAEARRILSQFEGRPLAEEDMAHEPQGRPFFPDRRDVSFNIAHSGTLAAVSYSGGGNLRTGCDVEQ